MRSIVVCLGLCAASAAPAVLAQRPVPPPCAGSYTRVRVSTIKAGMMPQFEQAVAANLAWYRSHNIRSNQIVMAKIIDDSGKYSETEAMTYHFNPPQATFDGPKPDDAYKAFVKMYNDSSTIKMEYTVCMPKMGM
jgi:hypothetical protein